MDRTGISSMKKIILNLVVFVSITLLYTGCSNYRLGGTPINLPFRSVYVQPVKNLSYAPQATNLLTNAISDAISQTPELKVANVGDADAVLDVVLTGYNKRMYASKSTENAKGELDTALAAAYKITAVAECTLTVGGKVLFNKRKVEASVIIYHTSNDFINSEYQNMPVLMRDLGRKIKDTIIGIW